MNHKIFTLVIFILIALFLFRDSAVTKKSGYIPVDALELSLGSLEAAGLRLDGLRMKLERGRGGLAGPLSARFSGGDIMGDLLLRFFSYGTEYELILNVKGLDLDKLNRALKLQDKIAISGTLSGSIRLRGRNGELTSADGDLSAWEPGGVFIIKDEKFLAAAAGENGPSLSVLVENFKDYRYNIGKFKISMEGGAVKLDVALDGLTGKRSLTIAVHDFSLK